jgi:hypothetical protein
VPMRHVLGLGERQRRILPDIGHRRLRDHRRQCETHDGRPVPQYRRRRSHRQEFAPAARPAQGLNFMSFRARRLDGRQAATLRSGLPPMFSPPKPRVRRGTVPSELLLIPSGWRRSASLRRRAGLPSPRPLSAGGRRISPRARPIGPPPGTRSRSGIPHPRRRRR